MYSAGGVSAGPRAGRGTVTVCRAGRSPSSRCDPGGDVRDGRGRARTAAVCTALLFALAACASTTSPNTGGDPFSALPGTVSSIPTPPSASPDEKARAAVPSDPGPEWKRVTKEDFDSFRTDDWGTYDSVGAFGNGLRRSS